MESSKKPKLSGWAESCTTSVKSDASSNSIRRKCRAADGEASSPWQELPSGMLLMIMRALHSQENGEAWVRRWLLLARSFRMWLEFMSLRVTTCGFESIVDLLKVRRCGCVCHTWKGVSAELLMTDTAASRPPRYDSENGPASGAPGHEPGAPQRLFCPCSFGKPD